MLADAIADQLAIADPLDEAARARRLAHARSFAEAMEARSAQARSRSPDKQASIERRRRLAASGPMPPALAAKFTTSWPSFVIALWGS
jgi:hypothetical protein